MKRVTVKKGKKNKRKTYKKKTKHRRKRRNRSGGGNFGDLEEKEKNLFDYLTFEKASSMKFVEEESANVIVYDVVYTIPDENNLDIISHALLKSNLVNEADSLFYEYMVGKFINKLTKIYPCFVETYGLLKYKDLNFPRYLNAKRGEKEIDLTNDFKLTDKISVIDTDKDDTIFMQACMNPTLFAVLIQYLPNIENIIDKIEEKNSYRTVLDLMHILFQIYAPLANVSYKFTHNNLRVENVALFKPYGPNEYIQFNYDFGGKMISFKSQYMVKIINYGRSFFYDEEMDYGSLKVYEKICRTRECNKDRNRFKKDRNRPRGEGCGAKVGFSYFNLDAEASSVKRNISTDLLFSIFIKEYIEAESAKPDKWVIPDNLPTVKEKFKLVLTHLSYLTKNLVFENNENDENDSITTPENEKIDDNINNVTGLAKDLLLLISRNDFYKEINDFLYDDTQKKMITLNIDMIGNTPMTYS
jgi:hypothetical protein